ncbi:hematopoietic SH2 domain-containing protein-like isoform X1 [Cynocephalus volans]|uniref:hematopoietic SH2 domain-containing protein-like isoform X1 n=1 Tax=Cynocephalus volans TaxID=110931 RepID=UPI002FC610B8
MTEAGKLPPPLPPRLDWFVHTQMSQLARDGVPEWFHGAISREAAENLLESQPLGSFLIRVSHSHVGYTLSYRAHSCCRHFMVKLLDDGSFVILGENVSHASLDALVTFHQQKPVRPHGELLTQPCGQKDPANVDYEDLLLYSNALAEKATSPAYGPQEHQRPSFCSASAKLVLLHQPKKRKPSAELNRVLTEEAASFCLPKSPLGEAHQKLWKNLKMLPKMGKRVQQQLESHLQAVSLSSLGDTGQSAVTHTSRARAGSQEHSGDAAWKDSVYTDLFLATSLESPSQPQSPRDRNAPSKKAERSASWSWHRVVARALSSQVSEPEPKDLTGTQEDQLPEEYHPPPPFAPGYC